eukprot:152456-Rhodomonas_salina.2
MSTWQKTMNVNFFGVVNTCQLRTLRDQETDLLISETDSFARIAQAFVPAMQTNADPSIVVCTGSKQGITCPPGNLSYNVNLHRLHLLPCCC